MLVDNPRFPERVDVGHQNAIEVVRMSQHEDVVDCWEIHAIDIPTLRRCPVYELERIASKIDCMLEHRVSGWCWGVARSQYSHFVGTRVKSTVGGFEFTFQRGSWNDETFVSIPDHVDIFIP